MGGFRDFYLTQRHVVRQGTAAAVRQIRTGDWSSLRVMATKSGLKVVHTALLPVGFLLAAAIRLIRPMLLVRVNVLTSERIGHFAGNTELYLCARDAGLDRPKSRYVDLWYHNWPKSNRQLARMFDRVLHVGPTWLLKPLDRANAVLPGGEVHKIGRNAELNRDNMNFLERFPPHLSFRPEEEVRGQAALREMGIPRDGNIVCLNVRDSAYLEKTLPWKDWEYHSYRNSKIGNYAAAAKELADRGYYVIRMGSAVREPIGISHPRVIDYAINGARTDFMDVYLSARAKFFISTGTGIDAIAMIFRVPYLLVNLVPIEHAHTHSRNLLFIPKGHWSPEKSRFLTFREIFESGAGQFGYTRQFAEAGIELVENTPQEICDAVVEMEERLAGTWEATEEDEELQRRFWKIFPNSIADYDGTRLHGAIRGRIGTRFLREHVEWLS